MEAGSTVEFTRCRIRSAGHKKQCGEGENGSPSHLALAANPVTVAVEPVGIRGKNREVLRADVAAIQVGR